MQQSHLLQPSHFEHKLLTDQLCVTTSFSHLSSTTGNPLDRNIPLEPSNPKGEVHCLKAFLQAYLLLDLKFSFFIHSRYKALNKAAVQTGTVYIPRPTCVVLPSTASTFVPIRSQKTTDRCVHSYAHSKAGEMKRCKL